VLTTFDLDEYVYSALRAGARGFLLKDTRPRQLLEAIEVVAAGDLGEWDHVESVGAAEGSTRRLASEAGAACPIPRADCRYRGGDLSANAPRARVALKVLAPPADV
jgi:DNA-binding NarL/FixJ family response regulator